MVGDNQPGARPHAAMRGIYGGVPDRLMTDGKTLANQGVNAVFIGSRGLTADAIARIRAQGARIFGEFNSLHDAAYVADHPDAAPIGPDGAVCPPPDGWQGACPTHPGYRRARMEEFTATLREHDIDGIWLDYHHAHTSWEQAIPNLPDTCFCERCLDAFCREIGIALPDGPTAARSAFLLGAQHDAWVSWRCALFTDWVREYRALVDAIRPRALLGTYHCPWSDDDFDGALRANLAIDLRAQAPYLDVLSPMPYHARFAHAAEPAWISRQVAWLGAHLGLAGREGERPAIWPIVQISDWGETVPAEQIETVLDHGSRPPATGVMVFAWGGFRDDDDKLAALTGYYRRIAGIDA